MRCDFMTLEESKKLNKDFVVTYGIGQSPFGSCFIARTDRGICQLAFFDHDEECQSLENSLYSEWRNALIVQDNEMMASCLNNVFEKKQNLKILLKGSLFQQKVWQALLTISEGTLVAYQDIAKAIKNPKAVRATASAIAKNNIAYLIPCHRVIRQSGDIGQYRWGKKRKKAMIDLERS